MRKSRIVAALAVGLTFQLAVASVALAADLPSSKWAAALGQLTSLRHAQADTDPGSPAPTADDTGWRTVARTYIKTPNQKELAFSMALQCGLVTDTTVRSKNGNLSTSTAQARIQVRIKVTDEAGNVRYASPNEVNPVTNQPDPDLGVTYCDRLQTLAAKFSGLNCTADLVTGAVTCADPEELRLLLQTLNANAFNFLLADVVPGVQKIEVQARAQANASVFSMPDEPLGSAAAEAFVGLGSLLVEQIRLIKDADGTPVLQ